VARLGGARPGPTILLRADMDALPMREDTGLPFASEVEGGMHACGHDAHVAMLVGAARVLTRRRDTLAGSVLFMFQPGEEGYHGARVMLEEGLLDGAQAPSGAFALHVAHRHAAGVVATRPGPAMASGDTIHVVVRGKGGHASAPHDCLDPRSRSPSSSTTAGVVGPPRPSFPRAPSSLSLSRPRGATLPVDPALPGGRPVGDAPPTGVNARIR
jgi:hippurate hydrolase